MAKKPPAPPSTSSSSYRRRRLTATTASSSTATTPFTAPQRPDSTDTQAAVLANTADAVAFPEKLKGQAGINAVLNQHMTHLHTDHATCLLSDPFKAERKQRELEFVQQLKQMRAKGPGIGSDHMTHDERRNILALRREQEQLYQTLLETSEEATTASMQRTTTILDDRPIRVVRHLAENVHDGLLQTLTFIPQPAEDLLRRAQAHARFLQAARTVLVRNRANRRLSFFRQFGRQQAISAMQKQRQARAAREGAFAQAYLDPTLAQDVSDNDALDLDHLHFESDTESDEEEQPEVSEKVASDKSASQDWPRIQLDLSLASDFPMLRRVPAVSLGQKLAKRPLSATAIQPAFEWNVLSQEVPLESVRLGYDRYTREAQLVRGCQRIWDESDIRLHELLVVEDDHQQTTEVDPDSTEQHAQEPASEHVLGQADNVSVHSHDATRAPSTVTSARVSKSQSSTKKGISAKKLDTSARSSANASPSKKPVPATEEPNAPASLEAVQVLEEVPTEESAIPIAQATSGNKEQSPTPTSTSQSSSSMKRRKRLTRKLTPGDMPSVPASRHSQRPVTEAILEEEEEEEEQEKEDHDDKDY
eukprot:m.107307 g.107307  ORF g.107307 m.107307 type:complete len:591 (-) comp15180_c1_seq1:51-1823(-)